MDVCICCDGVHNERIASVRAEFEMPRLASIRAQVLRSVLAVALPLAALEAWNLYATGQADAQHARQQVLHLAQVTASETDRFLDQAQDILNGLAARPAVSALDSSRCDPILKEFHGLAPRFANVVTMTIDGRVICSAVPLARLARGDPDRFLLLMRGPDQLTVGKAAPGVVTGRWVVPVGRPLLDARGGIAGAVVLPVDLLSLPVLPSIDGLSVNMIVGLVAADGTVLAHSGEPKRFVGTNQGERTVTRIALRDKQGTAEDVGIDGIARIQGFAPVPGTDWTAVASLPASEVYAGVNARIATSVLLAIAILSAALLLAVQLSRKIHEPIAAIAHAADEVAAGNLAARAPVAGAAEIAAVATQFNRMLDSRARVEAGLRESEEKFSKAFHSNPAIVALTTLDGKNVDVNQAYLDFLGKTREEVLGKSVVDLQVLSVEEGQKILELIQQGGGSLRNAEIAVRFRDGSLRHFFISVDIISLGGVPHRLTTLLDSTERKAAEETLRESRTRLQALTRRLLEVQETERRTIARELHDEVGGVLTAVKLNLLSLRRKRLSDAGEAALADGLALVDGAIQTVRSRSLDLRPAVLDDLGLIPALKWYCGRQAQRAGVAIELALDAIDLKSAPQLESTCFRIVQESVTNALRHAKARRIQVTLHRDEDSLVLEIADDGTGFAPAAARRRGLAGESSGLLGMEERANLLGGRLGIDSAPGAGTRVWVKFSLPQEAHA